MNLLYRLGLCAALSPFVLAGCGTAAPVSSQAQTPSYTLTLSGENLGAATKENLHAAFEKIPDTVDQFMILEPSPAVGESLYLQTALLQDGSYELEVCIQKGEGWVMYGAYYTEKSQVEQAFLDYLLEQRVPDYQSWEIVLES